MSLLIVLSFRRSDLAPFASQQLSRLRRGPLSGPCPERIRPRRPGTTTGQRPTATAPGRDDGVAGSGPCTNGGTSGSTPSSSATRAASSLTIRCGGPTASRWGHAGRSRVGGAR